MAHLYARARGAPPPELFDALAAYVPAPADALEIGCGPGNASLPLLERGFRVHAVELGENLAAFARERLAAFPFRVEVGTFEDASLQLASVDLVVCSSAFHWLDREVRDFEERLVPQTHVFDRQRYVDTLATFSDHATLPAEQRARLFDAIGEIIDRQFGGRVEYSTARLQLARRR